MKVEHYYYKTVYKISEDAKYLKNCIYCFFKSIIYDQTFLELFKISSNEESAHKENNTQKESIGSIVAPRCREPIQVHHVGGQVCRQVGRQDGTFGSSFGDVVDGQG